MYAETVMSDVEDEKIDCTARCHRYFISMPCYCVVTFMAPYPGYVFNRTL